MKPAKSRKPKLDERFLIRHNITLYEDGDGDKARLPSHVNGVKSRLLDFPPLPPKYESDFDRNLDKVRGSGWEKFIEPWMVDKQQSIQPVSFKPQRYMYCKPGHELGLFGNVERAAKADVEECEKIAEQAVTLDKSAESGWQDMYGAKLFKTFKCTLDDDVRGMWCVHHRVQCAEKQC